VRELGKVTTPSQDDLRVARRLLSRRVQNSLDIARGRVVLNRWSNSTKRRPLHLALEPARRLSATLGYSSPAFF